MDEQHFQDFYGRTAARLSSYLQNVLGDRALAEDLVQEAFLRILKSEMRDAEEPALRAYLYRIATNLAVDHFRRAKRERSWLSWQRREEVGVGDDRELRHDLSRTFSELKGREKTILWLAYVEEFAHREIAESLGLGEKSIRVLLHRARAKLASLLRKRGFSPEEPSARAQGERSESRSERGGGAPRINRGAL